MGLCVVSYGSVGRVGLFGLVGYRFVVWGCDLVFTVIRPVKILNFRTAEFREARKDKYCMAKVERIASGYRFL